MRSRRRSRRNRTRRRRRAKFRNKSVMPYQVVCRQ